METLAALRKTALCVAMTVLAGGELAADYHTSQAPIAPGCLAPT